MECAEDPGEVIRLLGHSLHCPHAAPEAQPLSRLTDHMDIRMTTGFACAQSATSFASASVNTSGFTSLAPSIGMMPRRARLPLSSIWAVAPFTALMA